MIIPASRTKRSLIASFHAAATENVSLTPAWANSPAASDAGAPDAFRDSKRRTETPNEFRDRIHQTNTKLHRTPVLNRCLLGVVASPHPNQRVG